MTVSDTANRTFTILHTNDMHSNLVGMSPSSDDDPAVRNQDGTRGGFSRLAAVTDRQVTEAAAFGPVLVLDAGEADDDLPVLRIDERATEVRGICHR